jgi:hypothetical protein
MNSRIASLGFLALLSINAMAADHPMAGVYYSGGEDGQEPHYSAEQEKLNCAWSFTLQEKNGDWTAYLIDKPKFDAEGILQYQRWLAGTCTLAVDGVHDSCELLIGPTGKGAAAKFTSTIYGPLGDGRANTEIFETADGAERTLKGEKVAGGAKIHARFCDLSAAAYAPFLSAQQTKLDIDGWSKLILPETTTENVAHMKKVLSRISTGQ